MPLYSKNIGICHYKIGKTDGVSLEIMKREKMLKQMGYQVKLIAGTSGFNEQDKKNRAVHIIPELDFDYADNDSKINKILIAVLNWLVGSIRGSKINIVKIKESAFCGFKLKDDEKYNEDDLLNHINNVVDRIKKKFSQINAKENFDYLFLHNIFSHGRHIAAAKAFYDIIEETNINAIAVNHDFYESYGGTYKPRWPRIKAYLESYVPPPIGTIKHITINSIWKAKLEKKFLKKNVKLGSEIIVFPDTFDFKQKPWIKDDYNEDLLETFDIKFNDLIILQATRIVERKAIELTIDLITELNKRKNELIGRKLYSGKELDEKSEILFAFGQFVEPASRKYKQKLIDKMKKQGVKYVFLSDRIEHERRERDGKKNYSLWDAYVFADLISYPSTWEGFGNQFLEAVFAKKPIVLFEYPVFRADIKKEGYKYISLGDNFKRGVDELATISKNRLRKATDETINTLVGPHTKQVVNENFQIAKKHHGEKALKKLLRKCLE
jgi:hypothetical protein